ncbi:MAG TPA: peptide-methionine (R)-S-oxide reductase, partial [Alcanivorax sp.]|nr:peptide-methionine (R)-S-oxide reductase [Alcanivorax sp.]
MTVSASGFDLTPLTDAEKQQRAAGLTAEERRILLNQGTEPPFCGGLLDNKESG